MWAGPTNGLSATNRVFSDDDPKEIDASTPDSALHRNVDLVVLKADEEGQSYLYVYKLTNNRMLTCCYTRLCEIAYCPTQHHLGCCLEPNR